MDKLMLGLSTAVIGMLVVFFGLLILIGCICVMTAFTGRAKKKAAAEKAPAAPAPVAQAPAEEVSAPENDDQLVAVIAAAIAAVWQNESGNGFVVRRIKRVQNSTARARAARDEQIFSRL